MVQDHLLNGLPHFSQEMVYTSAVQSDLPELKSFTRVSVSEDEKTSHYASELHVADDKDAYLDATKEDNEAELSATVFVNGEPVISTGQDVSRYAVDLRDDGDPSLTFRSMFLGTVFGVMSAVLSQVLAFLLGPIGDAN